ncbi:Cytochrome b-c1 complex subunit 9, mitochondrial [Paraconiothyrium brasiliense]|uniref:Complex III subunit 9 n=1 Tax=Paraconiothyrium brasiliense TaxID=300254 RepID=A0ABR3QZ65_9PLEO
MLTTVFASAFAMQLYVQTDIPPPSADRILMGDIRAFDTGSDRIWDSINRGRQWKDIKYRYVQKAEDDGDDDE